MTQDEFREWWGYHTTRFTWLLDRLAKMPVQSDKPHIATSRGTYAAWRDALASCPLELAKRATDALFVGDEPEPKGFDDHPRAVRRYCAKHAPRPVDDPTRVTFWHRPINGERTYECGVCLDEGDVRVYQIESVALMRIGALRHHTLNPNGKRTLYVGVAVCNCAVGQRKYGHREGNVYFDPTRHYAVTQFHPDKQWLELKSLVEAEATAPLVPGVEEFV